MKKKRVSKVTKAFYVALSYAAPRLNTELLFLKKFAASHAAFLFYLNLSSLVILLIFLSWKPILSIDELLVDFADLVMIVLYAMFLHILFQVSIVQ